jgi:hypothetical protein
MLQRLNMQQNALEGQKTFILKLMEKSLQRAMAPSLKECFRWLNLAELWEEACGILPNPWEGITINRGNDA